MEERQVAVLFSDVSGFTALEGREIGVFVERVMGAAARLVGDRRPLVSNTWGDAIFLVFATAQEAVECAFALRDEIRNRDWKREGIHKRLAMRIALHNAHVTLVDDPITRRGNAYGPQVSKTA